MENTETAKGKCRKILLDICIGKKFISRTPSLRNSLRNGQNYMKLKNSFTAEETIIRVNTKSIE